MKLLQQQLKHSDTFWLSNGLKKRPIFNDSFFNIGIRIFVFTLALYCMIDSFQKTHRQWSLLMDKQLAK